MLRVLGKYSALRMFAMIALSVVLLPEKTKALQQTDSDSSYYPLETGNIWVYTVRPDWPPIDTTQVLGDTVMPNLKKYYIVRRTLTEYPYSPIQFERCDSSGRTWLYNERRNNELLLEDFSLPLGSRWPSYRKSEFGDTAQIVWKGKTLAIFSDDSLDVIVIRYNFRYGELNMIQFARGIGILDEEFWPRVPNLLAGATVGTKTYGVLTNVGGSPRKALPSSSHLEQNYPNPFNPSTTISYDLPTRSHVTLRIFNVLGQEVATLVDDEVGAGRHQVRWNAGRLASGVYLYRIQSGTFVQTKKTVLVR
jgi:hypothetical protein